MSLVSVLEGVSMARLHLRLLLALCLIGVGTTFGALALSGYYSPKAPQKQGSVASSQPTGSQLVRTTPRQRFVAIEAQAAKPIITHTIAQTTVQATSETLPWAKPKQPIEKPPVVEKPVVEKPAVDKSPPREAAVKPKERPNDAYSPSKDAYKDASRDTKDTKDKRPQRAAVAWPWNLLSN